MSFSENLFSKFSSHPSLNSAGLTDRGQKRDNNEDNFYIDDKTGFFIVSDGMGGAEGGETASEMVVNILPVKLSGNISSSTPGPALGKSIEEVSNCIKNYTSDRYDLKGAGATVVACLIKGGKAFIGHMGDSRAYLIRGNKFERLTVDHTIVNYLISSGVITEEEGKNHPYRHTITRCAGMKDEPQAEINAIDLENGDRLLLCTDGLTGMLTDKEIEKILLEEGDLNRACRKLIDSANTAGGKDNITAVIIQYGEKKRSLKKNETFINWFGKFFDRMDK